MPDNLLHHLPSNLLVRELATAIGAGRIDPRPLVIVCAGPRPDVLTPTLRALDLNSSKHAPLTSASGVVPMAEPHVITALSKKRAELSGDIERTQHELQDMIRDLEHLDRIIPCARAPA